MRDRARELPGHQGGRHHRVLRDSGSRPHLTIVVHAGALRIELRIRDAHSLKEKRQVVKSITASVSRSYGVSVAEVDHQDLWNRATLGVAAVAPQMGQLDRILHRVERHLRSLAGVDVLEVGVSHLEEPE
ncbi:MAG: DUF503 domain-containing protein [Acidimicrobiia bacterium]